MSKKLNETIVIIVIIFILLAFFYIGYKMLYSTKEEPVSVLSIDNNKLDKGLKASNINTIDKETFYSDIVFDSFEKINKNFVTFLNTFFPSIDIKIINGLLKENGCNNDIQTIINNKNIDSITTILNQDIFRFLAVMIIAENNNTNIILLGLFMIVMINIQIDKRNKTHNFYYFNDYDEFDDFYIYMIPVDYTEKISKELNKDTNVIEVFNEIAYDNKLIYKYSIKKFFIDKLINKDIEKSLKKTSSNVTNDDKKNYLSILKENINALYKWNNYQLTSIFLIYNNNGVITTDTQILTDIYNILNSDLTKSFKNYYNMTDESFSKDGYIFELKRRIERKYNNRNIDYNQSNNQPDNDPYIPEPLEIWDGENYNGKKFTVSLKSPSFQPKIYTKEYLNFFKTLKSLKVPGDTIFPNDDINGYKYQVSIKYKNNNTPEILNNNSNPSIKQIDSSGNEIESIIINKLNVVRSINTTTTKM